MRQYVFLRPRRALNEAPTLWAGPTEDPVCPSHADDAAEVTFSRNIEVRGPGRQCRPHGVGGKKRDHRHHSFSDQHRSRARPRNFPQAGACSISRGWNAVEFCVFSWNSRTGNSQACSKRMSRVAGEIDRKLLFEAFSQRYEGGATNRAALKSSSSRRDIR